MAFSGILSREQKQAGEGGFGTGTSSGGQSFAMQQTGQHGKDPGGGVIRGALKTALGMLAGGAIGGALGVVSSGAAAGATTGAGASTAGTSAAAGAAAPTGAASSSVVSAPTVSAPSAGSGFLSSAGAGLADLAKEFGQPYRDAFGKMVKGFNPFDAANISGEIRQFGEAIDAIRELKGLIRGDESRKKGEAGGAPSHPAFTGVGTAAQGTSLGELSRSALGEKPASEPLGASVDLGLGDILSKPYMRY